jgi:hypothetical protein
MMPLPFIVFDEPIHIVNIEQDAPALSYAWQFAGPIEVPDRPLADTEVSSRLSDRIQPFEYLP